MNHRLPELWTEPDKFDPERFAEPRAEHKKHRYAFAPFGGGAHKNASDRCFAQLEAKTITHRLLRRGIGWSWPDRATRPTLGLRRGTDPDGRHADRVASALG